MPQKSLQLTEAISLRLFQNEAISGPRIDCIIKSLLAMTRTEQFEIQQKHFSYDNRRLYRFSRHVEKDKSLRICRKFFSSEAARCRSSRTQCSLELPTMAGSSSCPFLISEEKPMKFSLINLRLTEAFLRFFFSISLFDFSKMSSVTFFGYSW